MIEEDDFQYCHYCGGFVDYSGTRVSLTSPPIFKHYCKSCNKLVVKIQLNKKERVHV